MIALESFRSLPVDQPSDRKPEAIVLIDFENIASSGRSALRTVLQEVHSSRTVLTSRAYADWIQFPTATRWLGREGIEMIQLSGNFVGKNSADMQLSADGIELLFTIASIRTLVVLSGDRDFVPLLRLAKKRNCEVWTGSTTGMTSSLLLKLTDRHLTLTPRTKQESYHCLLYTSDAADE